MGGLVFVHGIGGARRPEEELRTWTAALARGAVAAGHSARAGMLLAGAGADVSFAFYGDLFARPGAQGVNGGLSEQDAEAVIELLRELVDEQLNANPDEQGYRLLVSAREQSRSSGVAQGAGRAVRVAIGMATTLLEWRPLRRSGQWASGLVMVQELAQVSRYLSRGEPDGQSTLDQRIRARVRASLGDGPVVVVAHSLGSIVAFEALHDFDGEVSLLITLGSPIAMRTVVWPRLRPRPPTTPEVVRSWLNFWDRDDIIAAPPRRGTEIVANSRAVIPSSQRVDSDGMWVHTATKYLVQPAVAGPVIEALAWPLGGG